eukprot:SAG31_NODE_3222_length_4523_cov_2.551085_2_plen_98_part_00
MYVQVNWIIAALCLEFGGFIILNIIGGCCSNRVVQADDKKGMEEIQKLIASGEAEYGGTMVDGKVIKRELPKYLGGKGNQVSFSGFRSFFFFFQMIL